MATSKNTGLTLTLVFFVIATLVSCVLAIIMYQDSQDRIAQQRNDKQEATTNKQLAQAAVKDIETLRNLLGKPKFDKVGDPEGVPEDQDDTVYWSVWADMKKFGGDRQENDSCRRLGGYAPQNLELAQQLADKEKAFDDLQQKFAMLDETQKKVHNQLDDARTVAEKNNQETIETHQVQLNTKDALIQQQKDEHNALIGQHDELSRKFEEFRDDSEARIKNQKNLILSLSKELADLEKVSFDHEDGQIVWTSNDKRTVWINLGSSDHLPKRMTFSVYKKQHAGLARTKEDIKGSIEIIKIIEPHLAEARVLGSGLFTPITKVTPSIRRCGAPVTPRRWPLLVSSTSTKTAVMIGNDFATLSPQQARPS